MKKALIATDEIIFNYQDNSPIGYRIVDVHDTEIFEPAPRMFWTDVNDDFSMLDATNYYYNSKTNTVDVIPVDPELIKLAEARALNQTQLDQTQPATTGTQAI